MNVPFIYFFIIILVGCDSSLLELAGKKKEDGQATTAATTTEKESEKKVSSPAPDEAKTEPVTDETASCLTPGCTEEQPAHQECSPPTGIDNGPQTIQAFMTFLNALPKPTTINCVIQTLKRPLEINATSNTLSAQGATGKNSPRIFIRSGKLLLSVLADGDGSDAIELAETFDTTTSIKGELKFPLSAALKEESPYIGLYQGGIGLCAGACHGGYTEILKYDAATVKYGTRILYPPSKSNIPLIDLELIRDACGQLTSPLCLFYKDLFDHGVVGNFEFIP
jgi:hypothetical protein